ncbi:type III pantothenate kinase [Aliikangiella coralliicola]|uniref:Type III pantothenate kinase n=1 Tax=Aliikangiella coralliicola TaxID=2592383 RepID=A0A545U7T6_9GAMM|nr:type III pantothenate kinase [Aliikangiella coralliicola]TQV85527.1 type III pantothenate kinase [Aliikangiella coralliicola]
MILLIDWGNTNLKTICLETTDLETTGLEKFCRDSLLENEPRVYGSLAEFKENFSLSPQQVLVASVRSDEDNERLKQFLSTLSDEIFFAKTSHKACGVSCAYDKPEFLGVDRWLAILAAEAIADPVAVIDIGSAITLDVVSNKRHLGGHIIPGKRLMLESLKSTGKVRPDSQIVEDEQYLGQSTGDCVRLGIDAVVSGYLSNIMDKVSKDYQIERWFFAGGGGAHWYQKLANNERRFELRPLIVFEGLLRLYLDSKPKT